MSHDFTQWWKDWWEEDYSWEGLGKLNPDGTPHRPWHGWCVLPRGKIVEDPSSWPEDDERHSARPKGARPATLQDYWREQKDKLIACPTTGKRFTILHLPLHWENGASTPDVAQTAELQAKFAAAGEGEFGWRSPVGPDRRVQCDGAVLRSFDLAVVQPTIDRDNRTPLAISARRCFFSNSASFASAPFSGYASFTGAAFSEGASFESAAFLGDTSFESAAFAGDAEFGGAGFSGNTWFEGAVFAGNASFRRTAFYGDALFDSAGFFGDAWFEKAAISGYAWFGNGGSRPNTWCNTR